MLMFLLFVLGMSGVIYILNFPVNKLEKSMVAVSRKLHLSPMVAGATFIAVTSSSPEFGTSFAGVVFEQSFEIGFQVIIWSALFNLLVITGASGIVSKKPVKIDLALIRRDMLCYVLTLVAFLCIAYDNKITWYENTLLIIIYGIYLTILYRENGGDKISGEDYKKKHVLRDGIIGLIGVMILTTLLVEFGVHSLKHLGNMLNTVLPFSIVACTFWGPGTSIVDLLMSIRLSRRGHGESGIVNGIASNTFDIAIVLGLNGLLYNYISGGPITNELGTSFYLFILLGISVVVVSFILLFKKYLHKTESWLLIALFLAMLISQVIVAWRYNY